MRGGSTAPAVLLLLLLTAVLCEDDDQANKDANKVDKELDGVGEVVATSGLGLFDDKLGVIKDETTHDEEPKVKQEVENTHGAKIMLNSDSHTIRESAEPRKPSHEQREERK